MSYTGKKYKPSMTHQMRRTPLATARLKAIADAKKRATTERKKRIKSWKVK